MNDIVLSFIIFIVYAAALIGIVEAIIKWG